MRHHSVNRKFGRERKVRHALLKSLASSLILKGGINTTEAKAKEIRPYVEKLVTLAKKGIAGQKIAGSRVGGKTGKFLATDVVPKYTKRTGGYTRITKLGRRPSDGSKMARIEFV